MKIAIFPGSFDPITKGHENLIYRASYLFDKLIVAIGENSQKHSFFPLDLRKNWVQTTIKKLSNVNVDVYNGLTVDYCKNIGAKYIVRGIRTFADFEFENHIAQMNKILSPDIETIFLIADAKYAAVKSSLIKEIIKLGGNPSHFLPTNVIIPTEFFNKKI